MQRITKLNIVNNIKMNRTALVIAIIIAAMVLSGCANNTDSGKTDQVTETEKPHISTTMKIEVQNTDLIEGEYSRVIFVDSKNVIAAAPEVYPDGSIQDDEIKLHANEDYQVLINFNEDPIETIIHIGEKCEQGYLMKINYAERTVDVSVNEDSEQ